MEDDCYCEYDSTWDSESDGEDPAGESQTRRSAQDKNKTAWALWHHTPRNMRAAKDMQNYRRGYPNLTDEDCSEDKMNNLQFYLNRFPSAPDDIYIESFLKEWKNDYKRLERVHSYIQWLFPLREPGVNYMASELTKKEIEAFKMNDDAKRRLVESYELMLGFYGIRLINKDTGDVKRAENWKERFGNLERNMHNNLRITRILKSLGELGFEHYQAPLVRFFLEETLVRKTLSSVKRSVLDYFLFAVLDKQKRQELVRFAYLNFEPKDKFVWCPRKIQKQFKKAEKKSEAIGNGEGKEDVNSRSKNKEEAAVQKDEGLTAKPQKGTEKSQSKNKSKLLETASEPKPDCEPVENGNLETECNNDLLGNGNDSLEDSQEMDQSPSPDTVQTKTEPSSDGEQKLTDNLKDASQEADVIMQTDEDVETEKPPKKKREDNKVLIRNGSTGNSASGLVEEKTAPIKASGQMSPTVTTPLKTPKHLPSLSSEREEKIPRTDFSHGPETKETGETATLHMLEANGSISKSDTEVGKHTNGNESDAVDMESQPSASDQTVVS